MYRPVFLPYLVIITLSSFLLLLTGCKSGTGPEFVLYASIDQMHAEPVVRAFEKKTGIKVRVVYDVEANKTIGLVNRLIAERNRPQADVFWNGEILQTIRLKKEGVLAPMIIDSALYHSLHLKDSDRFWAAFGGRARVLLVNTTKVATHNYPQSIDDLVSGNWSPVEVGIANPVFGTTATHFSTLYHSLGHDAAIAFFNDIIEKKIQRLPGNATVRDQVVSGRLSIGLTDSDDALTAIRKGKPVSMIVPDQAPGKSGALIIPNTVAMIEGGKNHETAVIFVEYLLGAEARQMMIESGWIQFDQNIPLVPEVMGAIKIFNADFSKVFDQLPAAQDQIKRIFLH